MSTRVERVRNEALSLSASERASLAHDLILSLEEDSGFELSREQEAEIAQRVQSVQKGLAKGRPAKKVFSEIERKYRN